MEIILYDFTHTFISHEKCYHYYLISDAKVTLLFETTKLFKLMKVKS